MIKKILIKKKDGEREEFDLIKIKNSLKNSGANENLSEKISFLVQNKIKRNSSSDKIYDTVRNILKKEKEEKILFRYNLPLAILKLGPEGFAFEKFIGEILETQAYSPVFVGKKISGKCITSHEMDVVAYKKNTLITAELKFHNSRSKKTDLKVALYMKARFDDIESTGFYDGKISKKMIITNTKFTTNAKAYSKCAGMEVLSWNFPDGDNLHDFILNSGVHPVTALETISNKAKQFFIKNKIVSCGSLLEQDNKAIKENHFIPKKKIQTVIDEILEIKKNNFL